MEQKNKGSCITFWMRGRRSAQPAPWTSKTWCLATKEQGLAGSGAPRPVRRRRLGPQRRGARRRRNKVLRRVKHHVPRRQGAPPRAGGPPKKDRRTVGPPNSSNSPTSPSAFSWSSSWIAASSGFWHVPARSGRSAAGPWNRTGSNNSCC